MCDHGTDERTYRDARAEVCCNLVSTENALKQQYETGWVRSLRPVNETMKQIVVKVDHVAVVEVTDDTE